MCGAACGNVWAIAHAAADTALAQNTEGSAPSAAGSCTGSVLRCNLSNVAGSLAGAVCAVRARLAYVLLKNATWRHNKVGASRCLAPPSRSPPAMAAAARTERQPRGGAAAPGLWVVPQACAIVLAIHAFSQSASSSSALRITLFFWQVALLVAGPAAWVRWAAFPDLNVFSASSEASSCPFPAAPEGILAVQMLGPLLTFALLAATAALHRLAHASRARPQSADRDAKAPPAPCGWPRLQRLLAFDPAGYRRSAVALYFFTFKLNGSTTSRAAVSTSLTAPPCRSMHLT